MDVEKKRDAKRCATCDALSRSANAIKISRNP